MKIAGRWMMFVVLRMSHAVCVLGRSQPSLEASTHHSTMEGSDKRSIQGSSCILGFIETLEVPWRRSLRGSSGGRAGVSGGGGGGGRGGGGGGGRDGGGGVVGAGGAGGGGGLSTIQYITIYVPIAVLLFFVVVFVAWYYEKKNKNPNWKFADCFKRT